MNTGNIFHGVPARLPDELVETLAGAPGCRIERIVSKGHCSPPGFWYDQDEHEWVLLLQGEAILRFEQDDRVLRLAAGDHVHIAAGEKHRVEWTADNIETIWVAVFYSARSAP